MWPQILVPSHVDDRVHAVSTLKGGKSIFFIHGHFSIKLGQNKRKFHYGTNPLKSLTRSTKIKRSFQKLLNDGSKLEVD